MPGIYDCEKFDRCKGVDNYLIVIYNFRFVIHIVEFYYNHITVSSYHDKSLVEGNQVIISLVICHFQPGIAGVEGSLKSTCPPGLVDCRAGYPIMLQIWLNSAPA